jgi:hypothetical protein
MHTVGRSETWEEFTAVPPAMRGGSCDILGCCPEIVLGDEPVAERTVAAEDFTVEAALAGDAYAVIVYWDDASDISSWSLLEDLASNLAPTVSIGFLAAEADDAITLVSLVNENHLSTGTVIPKALITKVERVGG